MSVHATDSNTHSYTVNQDNQLVEKKPLWSLDEFISRTQEAVNSMLPNQKLLAKCSDGNKNYISVFLRTGAENEKMECKKIECSLDTNGQKLRLRLEMQGLQLSSEKSNPYQESESISYQHSGEAKRCMYEINAKVRKNEIAVKGAVEKLEKLADILDNACLHFKGKNK